MPQELYLFLGSLTAMLLLSLLARALFPTTALLERDRLVANLPAAYPDETIKDSVIARDGRVALLTLTSDRLCLALQMGDDIAYRLIGDFRWQRRGSRFQIDLNDYSVPKVSFEIADAGSATMLEHWLAAFEPDRMQSSNQTNENSSLQRDAS